MQYSLTPILSTYTNKKGLCAVLIQVIYGKAKVYPSTGIKIKEATQWKNNQVVNHEFKAKYNGAINKKKNDIERLLLDLHGKTMSAKELSLLLSGKQIYTNRFIDFTQTYIDEMRFKLSKGRVKHYNVIINKILAYNKNTLIVDIDTAWLQKFENWLHQNKLKTATIRSNIAIIKAVVKAAQKRHVIEAYDFKGYKNVRVIADEPEFLTETELQSFFDVCRVIQKPSMKLAGYYFLLSCFTGIRLGDAKSFSYATHVKQDEIIVRAAKNKKIVTIPLYKELIEVLEYIHDKPLLLSEERIRIFVKEIAGLAGIKKHVKYHSSRHTCASRLLQKGLNLTEVADILGDTQTVTKIYSHIDKGNLKKKMLELLN
jgi:integrase